MLSGKSQKTLTRLEVNVSQYIDGFVLPIPRDGLNAYRKVVEKVAEIWKEHGALNYSEYVGDDSGLEGLRSFEDFAEAEKDEAIIFGWVEFESREMRDIVNQRVAADPRMEDLIKPLTNTSRPIFNANRMVFGGFKPFINY